jgi:D-glycero-D-manno-heptose 1,7-bisphosphate phosphatase
MLEVAGRPFLDTLIAEASRFGTRKIVLLAGHFGDQIRQRYDGTRFGMADVSVLVEPEPLGTGGALRFALPHLAEEFLLMNGDSWIDVDIARFAYAWQREPKAQAQLLLQHVDDASRFGTVEECDGTVTAFREKDPVCGIAPGWINAGVYGLRRSVAEGLPASGAVSLEQNVLPRLVASGAVRAMRAPKNSYFIDIGLPQSYAKAQIELDAVRRRPALFLDRDGTLNHDAGYTHKPSELRWIVGAREAIERANRAGAYVFVVTNQAGVAHGLYPESAVAEFHIEMQNNLAEIGAHIDDIAWCPHHISGIVAEYAHSCDCRKPSPGLLKRLMQRWPVDVTRSVMIGDRDSDAAAANAAGLRSLTCSPGSLDNLVASFLVEIEQKERPQQYVD